jgi:hypothetical protein
MMKKLTVFALALSVLVIPFLLLKKQSNETDKRYDTNDYLSDESL